MSYLSHAEKEFELAGWKEEGTDVSQGWVMDNIRELLAVLSKQGHSGSSAPYVLDLFNHLARFEIITPLTGKDEEWCNCSEGLWQNNRDSRVIKDKDGAWFIDGKKFSDDGGKTYFTNGKSHTPVTFPCSRETLKTEYIILAEEKVKTQEVK
jgi:hypothetical protein